MKESPKGTKHYSSKGLRMFSVYIRKKRYAKLKSHAKKQRRSMQYYGQKAVNRMIDKL
jgi:hypothetical protein